MQQEAKCSTQSAAEILIDLVKSGRHLICNYPAHVQFPEKKKNISKIEA